MAERVSEDPDVVPRKEYEDLQRRQRLRLDAVETELLEMKARLRK